MPLYARPQQQLNHRVRKYENRNLIVIIALIGIAVLLAKIFDNSRTP